MPENKNAPADWTPPMPPMPDPDTIGRGTYDSGIDGIVVNNSIPADDLMTFGNKTPIPKLD